MKRMPPDRRREAIVAAALSVAVTKGLASTTVRDVAAEMGTSSGLIHHYFESMDEVLAAAFERVARQDLVASSALMAGAVDLPSASPAVVGTLTRVVVPVSRSCTNTSGISFVSSGTSVGAADANTTNLPW